MQASFNNTAGASTAVAVDDEPVGSACDAVIEKPVISAVDAVVCVAVKSDVKDTAVAVDNIATAGEAVAVHNDDAEIGCVAAGSDNEVGAVVNQESTWLLPSWPPDTG